MKQSFLPGIILCLLFSCNSSPVTSSDSTVASADTTELALSYAYTAGYASDFEIGDPKYAQTVLQLWKDYDDNTLEDHKDAFADSVYFDFGDGGHFAGTRDSMIAMMKQHRTSLGTAISTVDVWTTLKPKGKDETWVCVWGKEIDEKNGKKDSVGLNENWMFNKDGKIAYMSQYQQLYKGMK